MANPVKVIGIGPGHPDYLLPKAIKEAALCTVLVGSARALKLFNLKGTQTMTIGKDLAEVAAYIQAQRTTEQVGVLVSGDPGFYSLLAYLQKYIPWEELEVIPGISSVQVAFSKLGLAWQEARLISLHGRPLVGLDYLREKQTLGVLVDQRCSPHNLARLLQGQGRWKIHLCRNLTYADEEILTLSLEELALEKAFGNCVVVIEHGGKK